MYLYNGGNATAKQNAARLLQISQWGDIEWTSMANAFQNATNLQITATDMPNLVWVTEMTSMFQGATNLTGNFSGWDTSRITTMASMFRDATFFNQPLASWDVSKVINFSSMFNGATSFDQELSVWTPISGTDFSSFLAGVKLSTFKYNALLDSWSQQNVQTARTFDGGKSQYGGCVANAEAGIAGRALFLQTVKNGGKGWTITDGDLDVSCRTPFIMRWQSTTDNQTLTLPFDGALQYRVDVDWGDGQTSRLVGA
jgi:surface protein